MRAGVKVAEKTAFAVLWLAALITIGSLLAVVSHILVRGLPAINLQFLTAFPELMGRAGGILPTIVASLYLTLLTILIAGPVGILTAIYLTEYTRETLIIKIIRLAINILAGIPSIIFGLFGFAFFVGFLRLGFSILSGALTVALMILPTIIRTTEEALKTVPNSFREGSFALGATKWVTIIKVVLPAASPGIITGIILGIGRVIGETAAIWLTVGGALRLPFSPWDSARPMTLHLFILANEGLSLEKAYATASVLIILIFIINAVANNFINRLTVKV